MSSQQPTATAYPGLSPKELLRAGEILLFILGVTFFSGGLSVGAEEGDILESLLPKAVLTAARYLIWALSSLVVIVNWRSAWQQAQRNWAIWALFGWVLLSGYWSVNAAATALSLREAWQIFTFGLFVATRFNLAEQLRLLAFCFGSGAVLSLILAAIVPTAGKHVLNHVGAVKGIYDYKNTLGSMMIIGMVSFSLMTLRSAWEKVYRWVGLGLCFLLMLLSTSKTALVLTFLVFAFVLFYRNYRWRGGQTIIFWDFALLGSICGTYLLLDNWAVLVQGLGKDPTMAGRTIIWSGMVRELFNHNPWLGFGRGVFWAKPSAYATRVGEAVNFRYLPPHGHNGYLDLMVDVGIVGIVLFLIAFGIAYGRALRLAYRAERSEDYWPVTFLTFLAMNNLTESYLMRMVNLYWPMFMAIALSLPPKKPPQPHHHP